MSGFSPVWPFWFLVCCTCSLHDVGERAGVGLAGELLSLPPTGPTSNSWLLPGASLYQILPTTAIKYHPPNIIKYYPANIIKYHPPPLPNITRQILSNILQAHVALVNTFGSHRFPVYHHNFLFIWKLSHSSTVTHEHDNKVIKSESKSWQLL